MIRIDMEMPESCSKCDFFVRETANDMGATIEWRECFLNNNISTMSKPRIYFEDRRDSKCLLKK